MNKFKIQILHNISTTPVRMYPQGKGASVLAVRTMKKYIAASLFIIRSKSKNNPVSIKQKPGETKSKQNREGRKKKIQKLAKVNDFA